MSSETDQSSDSREKHGQNARAAATLPIIGSPALLAADTAACVRFFSRLPLPSVNRVDDPAAAPRFKQIAGAAPLAGLVVALPAAGLGTLLGYTALPRSRSRGTGARGAVRNDRCPARRRSERCRRRFLRRCDTGPAAGNHEGQPHWSLRRPCPCPDPCAARFSPCRSLAKIQSRRCSAHIPEHRGRQPRHSCLAMVPKTARAPGRPSGQIRKTGYGDDAESRASGDSLSSFPQRCCSHPQLFFSALRSRLFQALQSGKSLWQRSAA